MNSFRSGTALSAIALVLTACGGGGGGGEAANAGTKGTSTGLTATISATNAKQAARAAFSAMAGPGPHQEDLQALKAQAADSLLEPFAYRGIRPRFLAGATRFAARAALAVNASEVRPCPLGGTVEVQINDADGDGQWDVGESEHYLYSECALQEGNARLNLTGRFAAVIMELEGDPFGSAQSGRVKFRQTYDKLSTAVTLGSEVRVFSANGAITLEDRGSAGSFTRTVSSERMTLGDPTDKLTLESGLVVKLTADLSGAGSAAIDGTLQSEVLAGTVSTQTSLPFSSTAGNPPTGGAMRISGAAGSTLSLTAIGNGNAELKIDADGDGSFEHAEIVAWDTLLQG